jgi:hypothetical protein
MRSLKGSVLVVVAVLALALAAQAGAGQTTGSNTYAVGGQSLPGVSTGLVLTSGMTVTVTAEGAVCPFGDGFCPGPDGYVPWDTTSSLFGGFVLPGAPAWGLVGRVGTGPWTEVGSGPTTLAGTGELVFAVNDDLFSDNLGGFTATVTYACWPGWGHGDENHTHCGPPGLVGKDVPGDGTNGHANASGSANGNGPPEAPNGNGKGLGLTKH